MTDINTLIGQDIEFLDDIENCEGYAEIGMRGTIKNIRGDIHNLNDAPAEEQVWIITVDYVRFEDYNLVLEKPNYYDKHGSPCLTAREAGQYNVTEEFYMPGPTLWDTYFKTLNSIKSELAADYDAEVKETGLDVGYVAWLEAKVIQAKLKDTENV